MILWPDFPVPSHVVAADMALSQRRRLGAYVWYVRRCVIQCCPDVLVPGYAVPALVWKMVSVLWCMRRPYKLRNILDQYTKVSALCGLNSFGIRTDPRITSCSFILNCQGCLFY